MFVVYLGAILSSLLWWQSPDGAGQREQRLCAGDCAVAVVHRAVCQLCRRLAEGRSRAQAASLRGMKRDTVAKLLQQPHFGSSWIPMRASELRKGVVIFVAGDTIALDGTVIEGVASVDESAITGESAPVIREAGGDSLVGDRRHARAVGLAGGGSHGQPGESFLDRMISMVESAKLPEDSQTRWLLTILSWADAGLSAGHRTLWASRPLRCHRPERARWSALPCWIALLVCLIPDHHWRPVVGHWRPA